MEVLWEFHLRRLREGTPPRQLVDRVAFSQDPALRLERCVDCGLVFRNPRERANELTDIYAGEEPGQAVLEALHQTQRRSYRAQARRLTEVAGRPGHGLEVGSYVGAFLAAARERGWRFEGVDVNAHSASFTRRLGFDVCPGELGDVAAGRRFDAVAIWNVFEQLADPRQAAQLARERLRAGGVLAVRVPNGACYAALRERLDGPFGALVRAVLAHDNLLGFPYRHGFTVESLTRLLEEAGFRIARVHGDALVPIADRWTRRWAAIEERIVKRAVRAVLASTGRRALRFAPWIEVYARAG